MNASRSKGELRLQIGLRWLISWNQDREIFLDHPDGSYVILRVLKMRKTKSNKSVSEWYSVRKTHSSTAGFENGMGP